MKPITDKHAPTVSGGVKPGDYGDCVTPPMFPEYPQFPMVPVPDPEFTDPRSI